MNNREIFEDIPDYEGLYKITNRGKVYGVKRKIIVKTYKNSKGYICIKLNKDNKRKTFGVHQLVASTFLNHIINGMTKVVNHKDLNKENNYKDNLEIISNRENCNKKHLKSSSQHIGVSYNKRNKNWISSISINGTTKYIGSFKNEKEASLAYLEQLKILNNEIKL